MTWDAFHRRADVLRAVVDHVDAERDGRLPLHLPGVAETFRDESDLLAALQLRWHTRLSGRVERALMEQPTDLEAAVVAAWRGAASELPGIRLVLDRALAERGPGQEVLRRAEAKEHALLAVMAGRAGLGDVAAPRIGRSLEERARAGLRLVPVTGHRTPGTHRAQRTRRARPGHARILGRLKAVLAA